MNKAPISVHVSGIHKGEEMARKKKEAGRGSGDSYRTARDSTGINAKRRDPIVAGMPYIPPA
jgi:hypothetical protein